MYLMRCKGRCGEGAVQVEGEGEETNQIACAPTKVKSQLFAGLCLYTYTIRCTVIFAKYKHRA